MGVWIRPDNPWGRVARGFQRHSWGHINREPGVLTGKGLIGSIGVRLLIREWHSQNDFRNIHQCILKMEERE